MLAQLEGSVLVLVDLQPTFLSPIHEGGAVLERCRFLLEIANLLGVRVLATEQYPARMGRTTGELDSLLQEAEVRPIGKMAFSCAGSPRFMDALSALHPQQVVLCGIETHICVSQTAHHLLEAGLPVLVGADAVGARKPDMHSNGLERMARAGATVAHTESIVYEWMRSAEHPKFRDALGVVKRFAAS